MGAVTDCAVKDLRRLLRDPLSLLTWMGVPLLMGGLMTLAFGGSEGTPRALVPQLLIAEGDNDFVGGFLRSVLAQRGVDEAVDVIWVDEVEGRERMDRGQGSALLVLPPDVGQALLDETPATLELLLNPSQQVLPLMVRETLEVTVELIFVGQRLVGDSLRVLNGNFAGDLFSGNVLDTMSQISQTLNRAGELLETQLETLPIELSVVTEQQPAQGGGQTFLTLLYPGLLFMALLFVAQGCAADLWREKEQGTLRRLCTSPGGAGAALLGKLFAGAVLIGAVCAVALAVGVFAGQLPLSRMPLAWVWSVLWGTGLLVLFQWAVLWSSSAKAAQVLTSMVMFPLLMLGGSFFPLATMPDWLASVGTWTPNGWAVARLQDIVEGAASPLALNSSALLLGVICTGLFVLSRRRLAQSFCGGA
ncbi:MAG: ABC-type Na+ efflux pump permease subunit [Pseudohongiellaceae bacterium]|jgi:ABC-type Na+ efflux pump permease subunit